MEFLASLAIKVLVGTSICGTITVGTIYKCDKTLLGFSKDDPQNLTDSLDKSGGDKDTTQVTGESKEKDPGSGVGEASGTEGDSGSVAEEDPKTNITEEEDKEEQETDESEESGSEEKPVTETHQNEEGPETSADNTDEIETEEKKEEVVEDKELPVVSDSDENKQGDASEGSQV